jgi:hypothetical protein
MNISKLMVAPRERSITQTSCGNYPRAVDENVHRAEILLHLVVGRVEAGLLQNVARNADGHTAFLADLRRHGFRGFLFQIRHGDFCAAGRQRASHGAAQYPAAARHERHLVLQIYFKWNVHRGCLRTWFVLVGLVSP